MRKELKILMSISILCVLSVFAIARWIGEGTGGVYTVTDSAVTSIDLDSDWTYRAGIYNSHTSSVLYAQINVTERAFTNNIATTNCVVIPAGTSFSFSNEHDHAWKIQTLRLKSSSGNITAYVGMH